MEWLLHRAELRLVLVLVLVLELAELAQLRLALLELAQRLWLELALCLLMAQKTLISLGDMVLELAAPLRLAVQAHVREVQDPRWLVLAALSCTWCLVSVARAFKSSRTVGISKLLELSVEVVVELRTSEGNWTILLMRVCVLETTVTLGMLGKLQ